MMLQFIRDRAQGAFVWIIIGIIIAAFALVGVSSYLNDDGQSFVADVNGVQIPLRDYQIAVQQERAFRKRIFGDNISPALLKESVLQRVAMDRLIATELVIQASIDAGLRVANVQLAGQIRQMKEFQSEGTFSQNLYDRLLNSQGLKQKDFEESMRRNLLSRQLMDGLTSTSLLTRHEIDQLIRLKKQQRKFSYMVLQAKGLSDGISVDNESVEAYYNEHVNEFITAERVSIEYLELKPDSIDVQIVIDEQQLQQMYEEQMADFEDGEERRARHILIKTEDETDVARQIAEKQARDLLAQLRDGADFSALAEAHSDDPGSARQGGDLGYFGRGMMVAAFENEAFSMTVGDISDLVQSPYGFHIIKLIGINAAEVKSFESVRDELAERFRDEKSEEQFYELVDLLTNLAFESPETLDVAAKELGLTVQTSTLFLRHAGVGVADDERIRDIAFSDDVLVARNNSEVLTMAENHVIVLRIMEYRPAEPKMLDTVRDEIMRQLRQTMLAEQQLKRGNVVVALLDGGGEGAAIALDHGSEWISNQFIGRSEGTIDSAVLKAVFSMPRPNNEQAVISGTVLPNGDYVIAAISSVRDGRLDEVDADQRLAISTERKRILGQHIGSRFMESLKVRAKVTEYLEQ